MHFWILTFAVWIFSFSFVTFSIFIFTFLILIFNFWNTSLHTLKKSLFLLEFCCLSQIFSGIFHTLESSLSPLLFTFYLFTFSFKSFTFTFWIFTFAFWIFTFVVWIFTFVCRSHQICPDLPWSSMVCPGMIPIHCCYINPPCSRRHSQKSEVFVSLRIAYIEDNTCGQQSISRDR